MDETQAAQVLAAFRPGPHVNDRTMRMYTITQGASDAPAGMPFGVREHVIEAGSASPRSGWVHWAATLQGARDLVPAQAGFRMPRDAADDPVIVEMWL